MKKLTFFILLILTLVVLSPTKIDSYAKDNPNFSFSTSGEGKDKFQLRVENEDENDNDHDEDNEFMVKGVISATSSSSLTIQNQLIMIDPSLTGKVKIVGKIAVGMYAKVNGKILNSTFYAEEIVVDNRNKHDLDASPTPTPSPSASPSVRPSPSPTPGGISLEQFNLSQLIHLLEELLNSLKNFGFNH